MAGGVLSPGSLDSATRRAIENLWDRHPRGVVGYAEVVASSALVTTITDLAGLSVTWDALPDRRYRTSFFGEIQGTVTNDLGIVFITDGSGNEKRRHPIHMPPTISGAAYTGISTSIVEIPGSGPVTRKMRLERNIGTGAVALYAAATQPAFIVVEDIGPA